MTDIFNSFLCKFFPVILLALGLLSGVISIDIFNLIILSALILSTGLTYELLMDNPYNLGYWGLSDCLLWFMNIFYFVGSAAFLVIVTIEPYDVTTYIIPVLCFCSLIQLISLLSKHGHVLYLINTKFH